jgi:hypothetical protein
MLHELQENLSNNNATCCGSFLLLQGQAFLGEYQTLRVADILLEDDLQDSPGDVRFFRRVPHPHLLGVVARAFSAPSDSKCLIAVRRLYSPTNGASAHEKVG